MISCGCVRTRPGRRRTGNGGYRRLPCVLPQRLGLLDHFFLPDTGDFFRDPGVSGSGAPATECRCFDFLIDRSRGPGRGDTVLSYADGQVKGIGLAKSYCYTSPRPDEFGHIGEVWDTKGWRVEVGFIPAERAVRPRDILGEIGQLIGMKHSPLSADGNGRQGVYLAAIPDMLANLIRNAVGISGDGSPGRRTWRQNRRRDRSARHRGMGTNREPANRKRGDTRDRTPSVDPSTDRPGPVQRECEPN